MSAVDSGGFMTQTLLVVVLFVAAMACLPWLVRRLQQRRGALGGAGASSRVLSQVAVGPHQRVVTVEVAHEGAHAVLVLGVTAQQVQCLHTFSAAGQTSSAAMAPAETSAFSSAMDLANARTLPGQDAHA